MAEVYNPEGNIVQRHPAEIASPVAMAVAVLIAKAVGVDDVDTIGLIAIVVAFVPAAVTWIVATIRGASS